MTSKICSKCNIDKDLGEFYRDKNRKDGYKYICKQCSKEDDRLRQNKLNEERVHFTVDFKTCQSCNMIKKISDFAKNSLTKDGFRNVCISCQKVKQSKKKNEEKVVVNSSKCNINKGIDEFCEYQECVKSPKSSKQTNIPNMELDSTQKLCPTCKIVKKVEMFSKHKARSDGLQRECKECHKAKANNKKYIEYEIKSCSKCGIEKTRTEFYKNYANSDGLSGQCITCRKSYKANNKERNREVSRKRKKERKNIDPSYKMTVNLRRRLNAVLKGMYKVETTKNLIGCSWEDVHLYLNEKNIIVEEFDVDHIIPCSVFDFTNPNHQKAGFHYTNLQKLPSRENQHRKRNKLPEDFNIDDWVEKQLEQIKKIEDDNLGWETVLELQKTKTFQGFIDEEDKWW